MAEGAASSMHDETTTATGQSPVAVVVRSESAHVLRDEVAAVTPHEVTPVSDRLDGLVGFVSMPRSRLVFVRYGGNVVVDAPATGSRLVATIPLGPMGVSVGGPEVVHDSGFLLAKDAATMMRPDPWAGALVVAADMADVSSHVDVVFGDERHVPVVDDPSPFLTHAARQAWSASTTLGEDTPPEIAANFLSVMQDQLMTALVLSWNHAESQPRAEGGSRVAELREWLEANHGTGVRTTDMARHLGLSVRQLQAVVQSRTGMSPSQLLREVRLQRAHAALRAANPETDTVARIAHACGFAHLGRFSQYYRARFGESPSIDLRRGKGSA